MNWGDDVSQRVAAFGSLILGIDPDIKHTPYAMGSEANDFLCRYTTTLLDAAAGKVGIVKFQSAYFEAFGSAGVTALARCIAITRERDIAVILDAKRGDVGPTAEAYARAYLSPGSDLEVDCLTVNPFLGPDSLEPFYERARSDGKGLLVLAKTSNLLSGWIQDQVVNGIPMSHRIASLVAEWADETRGESGVGAVGAVVGATYPAQAAKLRALMPNSIFLSPGLGAQGGYADAMSRLSTATGPVLVSASRGIAAIGDRSMSLDAYSALVTARIDAFKTQMVKSETWDSDE